MMAQRTIGEYFPVKKRRNGSHASLKRRKVTETTRVDIPVISESTDSSSIALTEPTRVTTPARVGGNKRKTSTSRKKPAPRSQPTPPMSPAPLSFSRGAALVKLAQQKSPIKSPVKAVLESPVKVGVNSPVKTRINSPVKAGVNSPVKTLFDSPVKVGVNSPVKTKVNSPMKVGVNSPVRTGVNSPVKTGVNTPARYGVHPTEVVSEEKVTAVHKTTESRAEMVRKLHRLSARELARPTKQEVKRAPTLKEFRSLEIESFQKETNDRVPAYKRFHSLAEPTSSGGGVSDLPLPLSYQLLSEKFRCTDTVVNMLQKRRETATFAKLRRAVQEMCRRDFELRNLAQISTVYPTAFTLRQERGIPGSVNTSHQLTVECNTDNPSGALTLTDLIKRRKVFHQGLVELVKDHHRQFLSKLHPPLTIPDDKVLRWHPEFSVDSVPEVPEAPLPQPPLKECVTGAAEVLREAKDRLTTRVQSALTSASTLVGGVEKEKTTPTERIDPALKGVSQALLDKIRAKEAAKARAKITRDPVKEKQLEMVARLPEFVRILRGFFVGEKKTALPWEEVVTKLGDSTLSKLSAEKVGEHLTFLSQVAPTWLSLVTVKKNKYVKLSKKSDVKVVLETIQKTENQLKC